MSAPDLVTLGEISGVYGIKGWVKVASHTEQRDSILDYVPWLLCRSGDCQARELIASRSQAKGLIVQFQGIENRDQAQALVGYAIAVRREQLPVLPVDQYYWTDLVGLEVINLHGIRLGEVSSLFATGANDVLVVSGERERLLPWIMGDVIRSVNLEHKLIQVDWEADF